MPPYRILSCQSPCIHRIRGTLSWGLDHQELRPAEDPNGFDLFLNRGRIPVKTWENRILGLVCYFVGLGGFCLPCYKTGVFRASGGLFARLHVFGGARGPLRVCVFVCMHEHHLFGRRLKREPRNPCQRNRGLPFVTVTDGPGPSCLVPPLLP